MARKRNQLVGAAAAVASAAALATAGLAAASAAPATRPGSPGGTVTGRLLIEGGPVNFRSGRQPGQRPIPGTIRFTSTGRRAVTAWAGSSGTFTARLPAGTYDVSFRTPRILEEDSNGTSHETWSSPRTVTVTARHATRIVLICDIP